MFGLMRLADNADWYPSAYARCCRFHRQSFGPSAASVVNFDVVFFYLCCLDAGLFPPSVLHRETCCRLRWDGRLPYLPDSEVGRFCAALSLVLADVKLQDDERDGEAARARAGRFFLGRPIRSAYKYFSILDPRFADRVARWTREQVELETRTRPLTLMEYAGPTIRGVTSVVSLLPGAEGRADLPAFLAAVAGQLALAVVALDCATDWRDDAKAGRCNPVANDRDEAFAVGEALASLDEIERLAATEFGRECRVVEVCRAAGRRVRRRFRLPDLTGDTGVIELTAPAPACVSATGFACNTLHRFFMFAGCGPLPP